MKCEPPPPLENAGYGPVQWCVRVGLWQIQLQCNWMLLIDKCAQQWLLHCQRTVFRIQDKHEHNGCIQIEGTGTLSSTRMEWCELYIIKHMTLWGQHFVPTEGEFRWHAEQPFPNVCWHINWPYQSINKLWLGKQIIIWGCLTRREIGGGDRERESYWMWKVTKEISHI